MAHKCIGDHISSREPSSKFLAFLLVAGCLALAQPRGQPSSVLEIAKIRQKDLDIRIRNQWPYPVAVQISPELNVDAQRLNMTGYFIEAWKDGKWKQLSRRKPP